MKITGNKGEWSELYVLLRLLDTGKLYAADDKLEIIRDIYFPILRIYREEKNEGLKTYAISTQEKTVSLYVNGEQTAVIPQSELREFARLLLYAIRAGGERSFPIEGAEQIMKRLNCSSIKTDGTKKADISVQIHDINTGHKPVVGFSIKSDLGSAPTLLNASEATNFVYECSGISREEMAEINGIDSRTKILDRMKKIGSRTKYSGMANGIFENNLMLIDSMMSDIVAEMLLYYYHDEGGTIMELAELLEKRNPLGVRKEGFYRFKIRKLLAAAALGMMPSKEWNGMDEANGGYIIVRKDGECVAYHIYNRDQFEWYLFENTKLERGSTSRHKFASLYEQNGKMYINLNLQIRFI